jgi:TrmH family RNA methyltransferase
MFPLSKLGELGPRTRLRKIARILQGLEVDAAAARPLDQDYLRGLLSLLEDRIPRGLEQEVSGLDRALEAAGQAASPGQGLARPINALRNGILRSLHAEPAEWDLVSPETGGLDRSGVMTLPLTVYLEDIRSPFNVGSIFRTAEAFGAARILISPRTPLPTHPRAARTALGTETAIPWEIAELSSVAEGLPVFALETGGTPLSRFRFPDAGTVLLGSEELGLSPEALSLADRSLGRVTIPLAGAKRSLNVSVAFGILMHAWTRALGGG